MTKIGSFEAKTHLPRLLNRVAAGETFLITKRGQPVAMLVPPAPETQQNVKDVIREMKALRRGNTLGRMTIRELIDAGRRF